MQRRRPRNRVTHQLGDLRDHNDSLPGPVRWNLAGGQRPRQIEPLASGAVAAGVEAADGEISFGDALGLRIDDAVAGVDQEDFADYEFTLGAEFDAALEAAFERGGGLGDAGVLHQLGGGRGEAGLGEFAFGFGELGARGVECVCVGFVGEVDDEFAGAVDVLEGVLQRAVGAAVEAEDAQRRVFGDYVEEGERRAVGDAVLAPGRDPGDRARDHQADEELVALLGGELGEFKVHKDWVPAFAGTTATRLDPPA